MIIALFAGCSPSPPPETFTETDNPETLTLAVSGEYLVDEVWHTVKEMLGDEFGPLERVDRSEGMLRTTWKYPATGRLSKYRVRLEIRFNEDAYELSILPEAQFEQKALFGIYRWWIYGEDLAFGEEHRARLKRLIGRIP